MRELIMIFIIGVVTAIVGALLEADTIVGFGAGTCFGVVIIWIGITIVNTIKRK